MGLLRDIMVLLLVEVFSMGVWGSLLVLYLLWRKLKRWGLLMYGLNVILPWFVLRLLLVLMFRNQRNTCLNYCGKIRFRVTHIFREGNVCADKLVNLGFIHRESFHWYSRFSSSLFLEFFMNRYSLPMCRFS